MSDQDLAFDRDRWQRSVGVLLTLIEDHGDEALTAVAFRVVNTNPYTGAPSGDSRADVARMNVENVLEQALAAGLVVRRSDVSEELGDLDAAVSVLEGDTDGDTDWREQLENALNVVASYARLGAEMANQ